MKYLRVRYFLLIVFFPSLAYGQLNNTGGELSGYTFGDYFWMASHHDSEIEGQNGFWFRRIYLTYDQEITDSFSSRIRLEMNSNGSFQEEESMRPYVKDAYLQWENDRHQILAGISPSPLFSLTEEYWDFRHVEKAPQDLFNFGSSRDFGIAMKGTLDGEEKVGYHFFLGNGNGNRAEVNHGKKMMLSLSYQLTDQLVIEGYSDWNDSESGDTFTLQGFLGYETEPYTIGALYSYQHRQNALFDDDLHLDLVSLFAHASLWEQGTGFLRVDHLFDPNPSAASIDYLPMNPDAESTFIVGGVEISIDSNIHIAPNVEAVLYGETLFLEQPSPDIVPRLTLFYEF